MRIGNQKTTISKNFREIQQTIELLCLYGFLYACTKSGKYKITLLIIGWT